jgi:hypothetical protein
MRVAQGYLDCSDDMQGILAATNMYTCDTMVELMGARRCFS